MGLRFILARRLSGEKSAGSAGLGGGLSSASNVIAIVSVALSVFVMILARLYRLSACLLIFLL